MLTFQKGTPENETLIYPLTSIPTSSRLVNPQIGSNVYNVAPPLPVGSQEFLAAYQEVKEVVEDVKRNVWPSWFLRRHDISCDLSPIFMDMRILRKSPLLPKDAANLVRMDRPSDLGSICLGWMLNQGAMYKFANLSYIDFIETVSRCMSDLSEVVTKALYEMFKVKYYFGQPRPEEWGLHIGDVRNIEEFGVYPAPNHPAYGAGHSVVAGATYAFLEKQYNAEQWILDEVKQATLQFGYFRTFAGVHYAEDNKAGWELGYYLVSNNII